MAGGNGSGDQYDDPFGPSAFEQRYASQPPEGMYGMMNHQQFPPPHSMPYDMRKLITQQTNFLSN